MLIYRRPLVSAVMITGKSNARLPMASLAVTQFQRQTYEETELIIVNTGRDALYRPARNITEIKLPQGQLSLGELRNIALDHASGEWVIQWDDDDVHHPDRISYQMSHVSGTQPQVLLYQTRLDLRTGESFCFSDPLGIAGTILHPRTELRYPAMAKSEDAVFSKSLGARPLNNYDRHDIYIRLFHGLNTWDSEHVIDRPRKLADAKLSPIARMRAKTAHLQYAAYACFD